MLSELIWNQQNLLIVILRMHILHHQEDEGSFAPLKKLKLHPVEHMKHGDQTLITYAVNKLEM